MGKRGQILMGFDCQVQEFGHNLTAAILQVEMSTGIKQIILLNKMNFVKETTGFL
jgi:hypothetical protein